MSVAEDDAVPVCVCGERAVTPRRVWARDELGGGRFCYVQCAACGAQRLSPRPSPGEIGAYYPDNYSPHMIRGETFATRLKRLVYLTYYATSNRLGGWRAPLRLLLAPLRGHTVFAFHAVEPRRIFEFGGATGNDLVRFRDEGWEVDGCEPSASACAIAAGRGIVLRHQPAEAVDLPAGSVSCVLLNNVLEHLHDPGAVLAMSARALVAGGSLVVIVPNHASISARLFGAAWPGYDAPRHLWGFTPGALAARMVAAGFAQPVVHHLFQGRWAWRSTMDGRHAAEPVAAWRVRWAGPLSALLLPFGMLFALLRRGDFIMVVATRAG